MEIAYTTAKIALCTISTEQTEYLACFTLQNKEEYAARHGYKLFSSRNDIDQKCWKYGHTFLKVLWLIDIMEANLDIDWFFWIDADAIIMNFNRRLEEFVENESADFVVGEDGCGINIGTFFIRNNEWSRQMLKDIWEIGPQPTDYVKTGKPHWWLDSEQGQIDFYCKRPENTGKIHIVPNNQFNSYLVDHWGPDHPIKTYMYQPGDFIIHTPGTPPYQRISLLQSHLEKVIK